MAKTNRGGSSRGGSASRGNGRSGVLDIARDRPVAAAAVAAGAAAAGLFLWSKRSQITNEISRLSDQIGEWTEGMTLESSSAGSEDNAISTSPRTSATRSAIGRNRAMSETGGGNASIGAASGGGGTLGSASGRGRARSAAATQE